MSRNLHILARAGILVAICCFASFSEDRYVIHVNGDISRIASQYGLKVVQSFSGSGNGHHVLAGSGWNSVALMRRLSSDAAVVSVEHDQPVFLPGQHSGSPVHPPTAEKGQALPLDGTMSWYYSSMAPKGYTIQRAAS